MSPIYTKLYLVKTIGEMFAKTTPQYEPHYTIDKNNITIYNFVDIDTSNFIELVPTNETYNLLDKKSRKIIVDKNTLENKEQREIIINAIRAALTETNQASEMDNIYILKDLSILVASDDWSDEHEILLS